MGIKVESETDGIKVTIFPSEGNARARKKDRHNIEALAHFFDEVVNGHRIPYISERQSPEEGVLVIRIRAARKGRAHVQGLPVNTNDPRGMYPIAVLKD